ncbi:hypothetical protein [Micromonospora sp. WMMC273]|uniref:hypothetical protein n=1 Tax=Micromonospora sp. WMMC273 TaxID=3015157 RepID=UPI0022B5F810|nr:hypothetical protein [Micromonospora sp. WMMC273]MCZ7478848.1 hypothetical protein [Micromonospora sp. WMMC273]
MRTYLSPVVSPLGVGGDEEALAYIRTLGLSASEVEFTAANPSMPAHRLAVLLVDQARIAVALAEDVAGKMESAARDISDAARAADRMELAEHYSNPRSTVDHLDANLQHRQEEVTVVVAGFAKAQQLVLLDTLISATVAAYDEARRQGV